MSLLTTPLVADTVARFMGSFQPPAAKGALGFPEIRGLTTELEVATRHGKVACTLYVPTSASAPNRGVYINFHGGGFVVPGRRQDDPWCRFLAENAELWVLNVEYGTAPRSRFPVAIEQAYDIALWAANDEHDWDATRLAVGGQSAGGNIAAAVATMALRAQSAHLTLQVLHYAPLDLVTDIRDKPSPLQKTVLKPWMRDVFDKAYVPSPDQRRDSLVSPAWTGNTDDLTGITPAIVAVCRNDRLRVDGIRYANRLEAVDALVALVDIPDSDHGYNLLTTREAAERGYNALLPLIRQIMH